MMNVTKGEWFVILGGQYSGYSCTYISDDPSGQWSVKLDTGKKALVDSKDCNKPVRESGLQAGNKIKMMGDAWSSVMPKGASGTVVGQNKERTHLLDIKLDSGKVISVTGKFFDSCKLV